MLLLLAGCRSDADPFPNSYYHWGTGPAGLEPDNGAYYNDTKWVVLSRAAGSRAHRPSSYMHYAHLTGMLCAMQARALRGGQLDHRVWLAAGVRLGRQGLQPLAAIHLQSQA